MPEGASGGTVLALDEYEAIRLADLEGLYQEQAAERMNVSRPTFGRILATAHRKVAEALVFGHTLRIEGGTIRVEQPGPSGCACPRCRRTEGAVEVGGNPAPADACRGVRRRRTGCRNR
jgi:predicted DNA-binding protein (UPF0251 family)